MQAFVVAGFLSPVRRLRLREVARGAKHSSERQAAGVSAWERPDDDKYSQVTNQSLRLPLGPRCPVAPN